MQKAYIKFKVWCLLSAVRLGPGPRARPRPGQARKQGSSINAD